MSDAVDELADLIQRWLYSSSGGNTGSDLAALIRAEGYQRLVVDDAMIERARAVLVLQHPETVRAALTAALETDAPACTCDKFPNSGSIICPVHGAKP